MKQFCKDCAYSNETQCNITGKLLPPEACSEFYNTPFHCSICHKQIHHTQVIYDSKTESTICPECLERLSSCDFCSHADRCAYQQDPSTLPKIIQQRTPFGVTQTKNPEREQLLCTTCVCWHDNSCARGSSCGRQDPIK